MATKRVWYPEGFELPTADIVQMVDSTPAYNYSEIAEKASSDYGPGFVGAAQATPDIAFRSRQIKDVLDYCTDKDLCANFSENPPGTPYNVRFFCRAGRPFGVREADDFSPSNPVGGDPEDRHHVVDLVNSAFLCWESLSASQGQPAEVNARFSVAQQNPLLDPFVWSGALPGSLPTLVNVQHLYTLGPVALGPDVTNVRVNGVQSIDWQNNIVREEQYSDGEPFPTLQGIREIAPVLTVRSTDAGIFDTFMIGTDQRGQVIPDVTVYLRKMDMGQMIEADDSTTAIRLRMPFALLTCRTMSDNPTMLELNFRPYKTSATEMFEITTAVDIPAEA